MPAEKLQKLMAQSGLGSRRACEQMIFQGRVTVNGRVAKLGERAELATDEIRVDGVPLARPEPLTYIALHKPAGVLSSSQPQGGRATVLDLVSSGRRLYPVGRLDFASEGLMLLTNDGELAHRLTHPRYQHEKEYRVHLDRTPSEEDLRRWRQGVALGDGTAFGPCKVVVDERAGRDDWVTVILTEGRKRQIRNTAEALGLRVRRLIRTRLATLTLGDLAPGRWRALTSNEVARLRLQAGLGPSRERSAERMKTPHGG